MIRTFIRMIIIISVSLLFFSFAGNISKAEEGQLGQRLAKIRSKNKGAGTDLAKLEKECLDLLKEYEVPKDKGKIYATIVRIYTDKGYPPDKYIDIYCSKTAEYCEKALQCPLGIITTCSIYFKWGEALEIKHKYDNMLEEKDDFTVIRRKIAILWLTGLRLALDNLTATKMQALPVVNRYNVPPSDPMYHELIKKHKEEIAARKRVMFQNKLIRLRNLYISKCIYLYSLKPDATDELKDLAEKIIKNPKVVKQLTTSLVRVKHMMFDPHEILADGISTSQASAIVTPPGRKLRWSIRGNALGCTIDPDSGVITAGTQVGTITIRATDTKVPVAWAEGTLTLEPKK